MLWTQKIGAGVVGVGMLTAVGGCATDGTAIRADSDGSSPVSTADPTRIPSLMLTEADFPAGYTLQKVSRGEIERIRDTLANGSRAAEVTPSRCMKMSELPTTVDVDDVGMVVATRGTGALSETLIPAETSSLDDYRSAVSGDCEHVTVTMTVGGTSVETKVDQRIVDAPQTAASEVMVIDTATAGEVNGRTVASRAITGYALVDGYRVSVAATGMAGGEPDRDSFDAMFVKAVEKVAADGA